MNTSEKTDWKKQLPACFGVMDKIFACHPLDEGRAKKMMRSAFDSGATIDDLLAAIKDHLVSSGASDQHVEDQLERARALPFGVD